MAAFSLVTLIYRCIPLSMRSAWYMQAYDGVKKRQTFPWPQYRGDPVAGPFSLRVVVKAAVLHDQKQSSKEVGDIANMARYLGEHVPG